MDKIYQSINKILAVTVSTVMGVLVIDVLWQVFTRFILRDPSSFTEELARYLMIWVGLLGAAYAASKRMHLAVDLLPTKLSGRRKRYLQMLIDGFIILFAISVLVVGGIRLVWVTFYLGQLSAAMQIPLGYIYLVVPVSGLLIAFYSFYFIKEELHALRQAAS